MSPSLPDYERSVAAIVPALVAGLDRSWLPLDPGRGPVVLLVVDGLGWNQLAARRHLTPTLAHWAGGPISTVVPSTTATALTSITTGVTPGEHGMVGYRMWVAGEVLNCLRWTVGGNDARTRIPPSSLQPVVPFAGSRPPVVARSEFATTGFTAAHLSGSAYVGWRMPSTLVAETDRLVRAGEQFVYAYYDGIDKVAHEFGLGSHYDAELASVDLLVSLLMATLPAETTVFLTADHGQVDVGDRIVPLDLEVLAHVSGQSGEGRFRWLHARPGRAGDLLSAATRAYGEVAWVVSAEQVRDERWLGPRVSSAAWSRLGAVALVPFEPVAFHDPDDSGPFPLQSRHGSLTADEMSVPLLAARTP